MTLIAREITGIAPIHTFLLMCIYKLTHHTQPQIKKEKQRERGIERGRVRERKGKERKNLWSGC